MIDLAAKTAAEGMLPKTVGGLTLSEVDYAAIHSIAPLKGARLAGFPETGKSVAYKGGTLVWAARGQYFLLGGTLPKMKAAVTDQSDAWCSVVLRGDMAGGVLARVCPLDTRSMAEGDVARSLIGHMTALILRVEDGFQIMVFRAFAKTLIHELIEAMTAVEARENIPD